MHYEDRFYKKLLDNLYDGVYFLDAERSITYWNHGAERITGYGAEEVVGCYCRENILEHVDENGNRLCDSDLCPAVKTLKDGLDREEILYLRHKDGHRVPVQIKVSPIQDQGGRVIGAVEIFGDATSHLDNLQTIEELKRVALLDPLTGIGNRRYGEMNLRFRKGEMERYGWSFGILYIDMDDFKLINDTHGHEVGDRALKMTAATLSNNLRSFDTVSRWGGEEFMALVVNVDRERLFRVGEKLRRLVEQSGLRTNDRLLKVTITVGGTLAGKADSPEELVSRADSLMYQGKKMGKNCVVVS